MGAPIVHVELRGLDSAELASFYERVFGWVGSPELSIGDYRVMPPSNAQVTAAVGPVPDWSYRSATFYVQVDDIDATLELVEAAGGRAVMPRTVGPAQGPDHIRVFTKFVDPAGNVVGLVEKPA